MQTKIISIKKPKLDFKFWLVKLALDKKLLTNMVGLRLIPKLSKEQILFLLKNMPDNHNNCHLVFATMNPSFWEDKDIIVAVLHKTDFSYLIELLIALNANLRDDKDVILAAIHNTIFDVKEIFELAGPSVRDNKEVVLLALHRAEHTEVLDVFKIAGPNAKQDPDVLKALKSLTYQ